MTATAEYVDGTAGRLYLVRRYPETGAHRGVLIVPPFAEEMNRCRRMFTLLGQALVGAGWQTVLPDLFATGDSEGEFADARWETWCADLHTALDALAARGVVRPAVVATRFGALLALDALADVAPLGPVVLWQPVQRGKLFVDQFLRTRSMAGLMADGARETVADLRTRLLDESSLEVAGYRVHRDLVARMDDLELAKMDTPGPLTWLDVVDDPAAALSPASRRAGAALESRGVQVLQDCVTGPPFWSTTEIAVAPALIEATVTCLESAGP